MFKNLKITCNEATTICDKNQYGEATFFEKIKLNLHFLKCKICGLYTKQNNLLTTIYKVHAKGCQQAKHKLNTEEKQQLKHKLKNISA